jgi:small subunit ribosomal protein S7
MLSVKEIRKKFVRRLMLAGKKRKAENIFDNSCFLVESKGDLGSEAVLEKALLNVSPILEVRSVRIAGSTYQIPFPIPSKRQQSLGISWIVKSARNRSERDMVSRLAGELIDASRGIGVSIRKRNELHKIAEANRAFAHYRWM